MKLPYRFKLATWFESLSVQRLLAGAGLWILLFAAIYTLLPLLTNSAALRDSAGQNVTGFPNALYFSIITATTLGYGDVSPSGWLRPFAAVEVLGGVLLAGLAVSAFVAMPSRQTRRAGGACRGWWLECCDLPQGRRFFSITFMIPEGNVIKKFGFNYDPGDKMDRTSFAGEVITGYFPMLISLYENDPLSSDYTEGAYVFVMKIDNDGHYHSYVGSCYDAKHGKRDRIVARRIEDKEFTRKAESGTLTDREIQAIAVKLFGDLAGEGSPRPPELRSEQAIVVTAVPGNAEAAEEKPKR